jgi:hypothetical protein
MWNTILLNIALSVIIIYTSHQIWEYCKINYTTHKIKNVADVQVSKYKSMLEDMERTLSLTNTGGTQVSGTNAFVSSEEKEWIRRELEDFVALSEC